MRAYRYQILKSLNTDGQVEAKKIYQLVVDMPSQRFWVSEERAAIVISSMFRGNKLEHMARKKREMFTEIFRRVKMLKEDYPSMGLFELVATVCSQPAPSFYLTAKTAKVLIYKIKRKWYEKRKQKLPFL